MRYPKKYDNVVPYWDPMKFYLTNAYWRPNIGALSTILDMKNISDFFIYIQVTAAADNRFKNTYQIARYEKGGSQYTMYTIPWDMNYTFGDVYVHDISVENTQTNPDTSVIYVEKSINQIFSENLNGAFKLACSRYQQYRSSFLSDTSIKKLMEDNRDELIESGAFDRNQALWSDVPYSKDISKIEQYVEQRMTFLDKFFGYTGNAAR
jgi:hypothetical protein